MGQPHISENSRIKKAIYIHHGAAKHRHHHHHNFTLITPRFSSTIYGDKNRIFVTRLLVVLITVHTERVRNHTTTRRRTATYSVRKGRDARRDVSFHHAHTHTRPAQRERIEKKSRKISHSVLSILIPISLASSRRNVFLKISLFLISFHFLQLPTTHYYNNLSHLGSRLISSTRSVFPHPSSLSTLFLT